MEQGTKAIVDAALISLANAESELINAVDELTAAHKGIKGDENQKVLHDWLCLYKTQTGAELTRVAKTLNALRELKV